MEKLQRRKLELTELSSVVEECESLMKSGYAMQGNWTLAQICRHLSMDIACSMDGYPKWTYLFAPLRPFIRWMLLPKLLRFESPTGIRTASNFVPPEGLADETELESYKEHVKRFLDFDGKYSTHPGFGFNTREKLQQVYSAHAAHHLSFLIPETDAIAEKK